MRKLACIVGITVAALGVAPAEAYRNPVSDSRPGYCRGIAGTLFVVPLPGNPLDPQRTTLYLHDRSRVTGAGIVDPAGGGTWIYLENGTVGFGTGGRHMALFAVGDITGNNDTDCYIDGQPNPNADDVVL